MAFPPPTIAANKAPGPPSSTTEHPDHHNALASAVNDITTELVTHLASPGSQGFAYIQDESLGAPVASESETWFAPDTGASYLYYDDGTSLVWVQYASASVVGQPNIAVLTQVEYNALSPPNADTIYYIVG